jgi:putative hemolysin
LDYHSVYTNLFGINSLGAILPAVSGILIFILVVLIVGAFYVSGSLVAFFALTPKEVNILKTKQLPSFKRIVHLLEQPKILLAALQIANVFLNLSIIIVLNILLDELLQTFGFYPWSKFLIKFASIALIVLLIIQFLPKLWATHHKVLFAASASLFVEIFNSLFYLPAKRLVAFGEGIEKRFSSKNSNAVEAAQIDNNIDALSEDEATIEEKKILKGIYNFGETEVKQIMRTRLDVNGIEESTNFKDLIALVEELHYSRLPVYKNSLDQVVGILHTKDLVPHLQQNENFAWQELMRKPMYVHEHKNIEDLLQEFRTKRNHFAVVVDEFGGTSGIVTLEDIVEEVIGEIKDEFDDEESINKKIDDFTYVFEGKYMINDACKAMNLPVDAFDDWRGESDSVAGLLLEIAGEFPQVNTTLTTTKFDFVPLAINKNRIDSVKIIIKQTNAPTS